MLYTIVIQNYLYLIVLIDFQPLQHGTQCGHRNIMNLALDKCPVLLQTFFGLFAAIHEHFLLNFFDLVLLVFLLLIQSHYTDFLVELY